MATSTLLPAVQGPPPNDPLPGTLVGEYKIERAVAAGGMGIVYVAKHGLLGRSVAVKVLRPEYARNDEQTARFLKEAQAISGIRHKGIVTVENFGNLPDGRQYMVMEFLEGENLEQVLQRDAPLHANRALPIMDEVLDALSAAHKVGVVHRDLKPSNIFLTTQSNGTRYVKLVDFGLAQRSLFSAEDAPAFAKASLVAGTPEYVSPEQARGLVATARTDIYCCGVILFEMLTGRLPFAAPSLMELLRKHVYERAPRVSHTQPVAESLDDLVASMLEKEPDARPRSADVVRQSIARILKEMKEASMQFVSRPAPLMRPPGAMAEPALEETHVSKAQGAALVPEPKDSVTPLAPRPGKRDEPKESRSDGRGKKVPADILAPAPLPKEPRSDGRGRKGVNFGESIDLQANRPPEAETPSVDAQMERTIDTSTSESNPLMTQSSSGPAQLPRGDATESQTTPKQKLAIGAFLLVAVVAVVATRVVVDGTPEVEAKPPPPPPVKPVQAEKIVKVEKVAAPPQAPPDEPEPLQAPQVVKAPEPPRAEPEPPPKKKGPTAKAYEAAGFQKLLSDAKTGKAKENFHAVEKVISETKDRSPDLPRDNRANEIPETCFGDWKDAATRDVDKALLHKLKTAETRDVQELTKESLELRKRVARAKTPKDCSRTISEIAAWVRAPN